MDLLLRIPPLRTVQNLILAIPSHLTSSIKTNQNSDCPIIFLFAQCPTPPFSPTPPHPLPPGPLRMCLPRFVLLYIQYTTTTTLHLEVKLFCIYCSSFESSTIVHTLLFFLAMWATAPLVTPICPVCYCAKSRQRAHPVSQ